ncbi:bifunctional diaminohydroxyphosphoribosylaminopyrimidine deaminase/5-amino-6-(5-phosphoribosylamino)uracil reductase RibD [Crocinitomicaceae bacterium]|nr:bifunctional diaminohydroxyphosphoribosylaminopyrimidine deaminase/5-amino-6-(5-phosphoribosylamino)uracil reductase RibD [Crocinitomicaceae bacterium]
MNSDEKYMRRALELASQGAGHVAPNPMVGAVVVHNEVIVGEGYHEKYGEAHAEVNAINAVQDSEILRECTIYVSLEPCAHYGKTPPCADLIVEKKLKRVVIGCGDSFAQVDGKGIERLKSAGIEVKQFVLEQEARALNQHFFTVQEKKRPYVLLKWAESKNGRIDDFAGDKNSITWISRPEVQPYVHKLRSEHAAILVGKNTVESDNPSLNVRAVSGPNPMRIVLDSRCELTHDRTVLSDGKSTVVLNLLKSEELGNLRYVQIDAMTPASILNALNNLHIQSVMIEGGAATLQSFIDANLWDEAIQIVGQSTIQEGTNAPSIQGNLIDQQNLFGDIVNQFRP